MLTASLVYKSYHRIVCPIREARSLAFCSVYLSSSLELRWGWCPGSKTRWFPSTRTVFLKLHSESESLGALQRTDFLAPSYSA